MTECEHNQLWRDMAVLRADVEIGPATKLAFEWLCHEAGGVGQIAFSPAAMALELGRSPRAVSKWFEELEKHGLIDVVERGRRGWLVNVYHPSPERRAKPADPQQFLPLDSDVSVTERSDVTAPKRPKSPAKEWESDVLVTERSDVTAQKRPPDSSVALISAPASVPARLPITKKQESILPISQSTNTNTNPKALPTSPAIGELAWEAVGGMASCDYLARQEAEIERRILEAVPEVATVNEFVRNGRRIRMDGMHAVRRMSRLILDHGIDELGATLNNVRAMRAAGNLRDPAAFFASEVKKIERRHGVDAGRVGCH